MRNVRSSLDILLLPKDIITLDPTENCLDIITSGDRGKLFEKYLSKRYDLKRGTKEIVPDCHLELKTTKKSKFQSTTLQIGEKNALSKTDSTSDSVSSMNFLIGSGFSGELEVEPRKLKVTCQLIGTESASLVFSFSEKNSVSASSQVQVKKGEWLNIASVVKDLNDKTQTIGMPQSEMGQSSGSSEIVYELQFK